MKTLRLILCLIILQGIDGICLKAESVFRTSSPRELVSLDEGWHFAFGNAASPEKDFGCGTEYFNYLTKAASIHNIGPYSLDFKEDPTLWESVCLPHDFAFSLPFSPEASHSHGYNCIGWKYPEHSVGWYRRSFTLSPADAGGNIRLQFEGIFREGDVWLNGIWLGHSSSGYISHDYDITPYLFYDGRENLICVRCDASLEEGWFYEGAGIYRHARLVRSGDLHLATNGLFVHSQFSDNYNRADLIIETTVVNDGAECDDYRIEYEIADRESRIVASGSSACAGLKASASVCTSVSIAVNAPILWDIENPYLYDVRARVVASGVVKDEVCVHAGLREIVFDPCQGMFLNGKQLKLKGFNVHQDHAGVGSAIPDGLQVYRMKRLKWMGANAIRACHNPSSPALLDVCDSLGILVIEENRLLGINPAQMDVAADMVLKGRNHPCIFTWSMGNEEWGLEWDARSEDIVRKMSAMVKLLDPTRPVTVASSSGPDILRGVDIAGYNYLRQHKIDSLAKVYPERIALGSEETTGCGTRGVYYNTPDQAGRMPSLGRSEESDGCLNRIERGWKFYDERPYLAGLFYWTGFDYRGEPNPLAYPAIGSQFGILDYCGFAKDEAWYLKSWWNIEEPCIHILPHWNLAGHEGEIVDVWVYSNCDEVEIKLNGRSLGRKTMPHNGHLEWKVKYVPGQLEAIGYNSGKSIIREKVITSGPASSVSYEISHYGDIHIADITILDDKGRFVPDACVPLSVTLEDASLLGYGNGDSAISPAEESSIRSFNGKAQLIIHSKNEDFAMEIGLQAR